MEKAWKAVSCGPNREKARMYGNRNDMKARRDNLVGVKHNILTRLAKRVEEAGSGCNPIVGLGRAQSMEEQSKRRGCSTALEDRVRKKSGYSCKMGTFRTLGAECCSSTPNESTSR
jgi:hypothetical protein